MICLKSDKDLNISLLKSNHRKSPIIANNVNESQAGLSWYDPKAAYD